MCPPTPPGRAPRPRVRFGRSAPRSASLFPVRPSPRGSPTAPPAGSLASALKRIRPPNLLAPPAAPRWDHQRTAGAGHRRRTRGPRPAGRPRVVRGVRLRHPMVTHHRARLPHHWVARRVPRAQRGPPHRPGRFLVLHRLHPEAVAHTNDLSQSMCRNGPMPFQRSAASAAPLLLPQVRGGCIRSQQSFAELTYVKEELPGRP